jgi:uncharacterized membrane protein
MMRSLYLLLHVLGVVIWVGGMFFAHHCLRPEAAKLDPPIRLALLAGILGRFFRLVLVALALLWTSGLAMLGSVGMAAAPVGWHLMLGLALLMTVIFGVIRLGPFASMRAAVAGGDWSVAAKAMGRVRVLVAVNLGLGMLTIVSATLLGRG